MIAIIERMKKADAKSTPKISLFDHCFGVLQIVDHMILHTKGYPVDKASMVRLGAFFHDIGKLNPDFQVLLRAAPGIQMKRVKHEAQTFDFYREVLAEADQVAEWIADELACSMVTSNDLSDLFAFAVTHHGLFYSALEDGTWYARREWTQMHSREERRITLTDLLIRYYPLGGAVIFADMLHSEQLATGRDNLTDIRKTQHPDDWKHYLVARKAQLLQVKEEDHNIRIPLDLLELLIA
ncbi:HD domain-containing protein [Effusibacillus consociatus]|uniref:HD domain-containing protein n=1 Tax=Effusibacillus consociatus TaxID=1117041 RepID=A0ABV9QAB4_9BACL